MKVIFFGEVTELTPPVPDNIALLQVAPIGEIIDGLGVNRGDGVFLVCEI
jgi:hypothetical protein